MAKGKRVLWIKGAPTGKGDKVQAERAVASGMYPVGVDECFTTGSNGGCNDTCYVYQCGECPSSVEFARQNGLSGKQLAVHNRLYPNGYRGSGRT